MCRVCHVAHLDGVGRNRSGRRILYENHQNHVYKRRSGGEIRGIVTFGQPKHRVCPQPHVPCLLYSLYTPKRFPGEKSITSTLPSRKDRQRELPGGQPRHRVFPHDHLPRLSCYACMYAKTALVSKVSAIGTFIFHKRCGTETRSLGRKRAGKCSHWRPCLLCL